MARFALGILVALCFAVASRAADDLVITRAERKIDLQSHLVRYILSLKVENTGKEPVGRVLFALTPEQEKTLAFTTVLQVSGKAKGRSYQNLNTTSPDPASVPASPAGLSFFAALLPEPLQPGASAMLEAYITFTGLLTPFPAEITQSESQLLLYKDSSFLASPYPVRTQTTAVKLPSSRVEKFQAADPSRKADTELRLGPYENIEPQRTAPLVVHFENNRPLPVAVTLTRELEISHWGNVYVTEDYDVAHEGAKLKGVFSRLELQMRPHSSGLHSLKGLAAVLPKSVRASQVYFRDEIGNISTSNLRIEPRRAVLELSPRYPLFGGWHTTFRVGYSLPLEQLVFQHEDGTRTLNATFGTPFQELPVKSLTVKVVLPEGSWGVDVDAPFALKDTRAETKYSYLDTVGRPVVVLEKDNVVQEHGMQFFQVHYKFSTLALLAEPLLLVGAYALFFVVCAVYVRVDLTLAKSSPKYQAKLQADKLMDAIQRLQSAVLLRLRAVDSLESSLQKLGRTGDVAAAKAARKAAEEKLKEFGKLVKDSLASVEAIPRAPKALALAQQIFTKDKEYVEKALKKHVISVEAYEKSLPEKEIEGSIAPLVEQLTALKLELKSLLITLDE